MKTVLNVKTDAKIKRDATQVAKEMGVPMSIVVNSLLKKFINDRELVLEAPRQMSAKLEKAIAISRKEFEDGECSPIFTDADKAMEWLMK